MRITPIFILAAFSLSACHEVYEAEYEDPVAKNGVWQGVLSDEAQHQDIRAYVLDGLSLSVDRDSGATQSAQWSWDGYNTQGILAKRGRLGERDLDFRMVGRVIESDRLNFELQESDGHREGQLSLFFDHHQTDLSIDSHLPGQYSYYSDDFDVYLSIWPDGALEAYDSAGCVYVGSIAQPEYGKNLFSLAMDVEACAMRGEYIYGLASLHVDEHGDLVLQSPVWLEQQDRVEAWYLRKTG